jgi:peptidylprolyl isomerase
MKNLIVSVAIAFFILIAIAGCNGSANVPNDPSVVNTGDIVQLDYTMKLEDGTVVFSTKETGAPMELTLGMGSMMKAFEEAVIGMREGETKTVKIPYSEAYGPHKKELIFDIPRSQIPDDQAPVVGMQLQRQKSDGTIEIATIIAISDDAVTVDTNNELAGKDLIFEIEVLNIL